MPTRAKLPPGLRGLLASPGVGERQLSGGRWDGHDGTLLSLQERSSRGSLEDMEPLLPVLHSGCGRIVGVGSQMTAQLLNVVRRIPTV